MEAIRCCWSSSKIHQVGLYVGRNLGFSILFLKFSVVSLAKDFSFYRDYAEKMFPTTCTRNFYLMIKGTWSFQPKY